jgi:hypothetical protein
MRTATLLALAICLFPLTEAAAQQVATVSGVVVKPLVAPPCPLPVNSFELEHTGVYVYSTTILLDPYLGTTVEVTGLLLSIGSCLIVDVQQVSKPTYVLETCGGGALGCPTRVKLSSPGGGLFALFTSLGNGFVPVGPLGGTFLLDPSANFVVLVAPEPAFVTKLDFVIPVDPALMVLTFHLQAARSDPALPGIIQMSTVDTIWTGTYTTPCHIPNC